MKTFAAAFACMAALLIAVGCVTARRSEPIFGYVPAGAAEFDHGRRAFMQHCHACHPGGDAGLGPGLNNKPLPAGLIKFQVRHGLGAMPALKEDHLDPAELDALVAYVVALRKAK